MDRQTKQTVIQKLSQEYRKATKKHKGVILTELIRLTSFNRSYARYVLRNPSTGKVKKRYRKSIYGNIFSTLRIIWKVSNYSCGKLLVAAIPPLLVALERSGELTVNQEERELLLAISHATCDRMLKTERKRLGIKGRSGTRPGTLLKHQIPIKIFTPWDEQIPGFIEMDLVAHCGDTLRGEYIHTLDGIDIATGWSEKQGLMGKGEYATGIAYAQIENRFPFNIKGIDVDSGSEFINDHFFRMTKKKKITFTRARAGKKNDQAHIEQKNFSTVRKIVGYQRFTTVKQLQILNTLYELLSDYLNYFIPTFKLVRKERIGAKIKRIYDTPKTPYQRVLEHRDIPESVKKQIMEKYQTLNPAELFREVNQKVEELCMG